MSDRKHKVVGGAAPLNQSLPSPSKTSPPPAKRDDPSAEIAHLRAVLTEYLEAHEYAMAAPWQKLRGAERINVVNAAAKRLLDARAAARRVIDRQAAP